MEDALRERKLFLIHLVVAVVISTGWDEGKADATILWVSIATGRVERQHQVKYRAAADIMANAIETIVADVDAAQPFDLNDHVIHPLSHLRLHE